MKFYLFVLSLFLTAGAFAQVNTRINQSLKAEKSQRIAGPQKVVILKNVCPYDGIEVSLSRDPGTGSGVSTKRYLSVDAVPRTFYATAGQVAQIPNHPALPGANQSSTKSVSTASEGWVMLTRINFGDIDYSQNYCGENGVKIPLDAANPILIYKVELENQKLWNSGMVEITDGTNLDTAFPAFLIKTYNDIRQLQGDFRFPERCLSACKSGGGGIDDDGSGWPKPGTWVDAANQEHEIFEFDDGKEPGGVGTGSGTDKKEKLKVEKRLQLK